MIDAAMRDGRHGAGTHRTAFAVAGVALELRCNVGGADRVEISIPRSGLRFFVDRDDLDSIEPAKLAVRLENLVHKIPNTIAADTDELATLETNITKAQQRLGAPYQQQAQLDTAATELAALNAELARAGDNRTTPPDADARRDAGLSR